MTNEAIRAPGTEYVDPGAMEWAAEGPKFWTKLLHQDSARGQRTMLMKIDPGASTPLHAHEEIEEIYVLSGSFFDQNRVLKAGDYACREAGAMHTAGSEDGAVLLLVYSRP